MKRVIALIFLVMVIQASGEDKLLTQKDNGRFIGERVDSLKGQKAFYSTQNWIPWSPPSEGPCVPAGCCLIPISGCFVGYNALFGKGTLESEYKPRVSIGVGYSPGIAFRGVLSHLLEAGEMDPFHEFYWNNRANINFSLAMIGYMFTKLSGSYMWAIMKETGAPFLPEEGYFTPNDKWEFNSYSLTFSVGRRFNQNGPAQIEVGIEYYIWNGEGYEVKAYTFEPVTIATWGRGISGAISLGISKPIVSNLVWNINLTTKYSNGREDGYSSSQTVKQLKPVVFLLTGVYIDVGIEYIF